MKAEERRVLVVGAGPAGLSAALACARTGARVVLAAPPQTQATGDRRTAALFGGSIELLRSLGVWPSLAGRCAPLRAIRIIDDTGALFKAPEVLLQARESGVEAFGYNVPNVALVSALWDAVKNSKDVEVVETEGVAALRCGDSEVEATTREGGRIIASLAAAADGRASLCRRAAGIATRDWDYPQSALVCALNHGRPHRDVSTEFHRPSGPFTVVPMAGNASSLVWVETPGEAQRLKDLPDQDMRAALEERLQGLLGTIASITPRQVFKLSGLTATTAAQNRVALIGEAGHVIPPIGAQGLNLGLRDAATLADCISDAIGAGYDPGGADVMAAFARARSVDVGSRTWTIDLLNRSLISDLLPVQLARGAGLYALQSIGPLRRFILREGVQPSHSTPALMRPRELV